MCVTAGRTWFVLFSKLKNIKFWSLFSSPRFCFPFCVCVGVAALDLVLKLNSKRKEHACHCPGTCDADEPQVFDCRNTVPSHFNWIFYLFFLMIFLVKIPLLVVFSGGIKQICRVMLNLVSRWVLFSSFYCPFTPFTVKVVFIYSLFSSCFFFCLFLWYLSASTGCVSCVLNSASVAVVTSFSNADVFKHIAEILDFIVQLPHLCLVSFNQSVQPAVSLCVPSPQ